MQKALLNTRGAARYLGCSENWIQRLVSEGKLKAYITDASGGLTERPLGEKRQGAALFFLPRDLDKYRRHHQPLQTRPEGGRQYSAETKEEALRLVAQGMSNRDVAKKVGVSYQTINNWVKEERQVPESKQAKNVA